MNVNKNRLHLDNDKAVRFIGTNNKGGKLKPEYLVIHYTAGGTADGAISWFKNPAAKASAHLVVGHNGEVTQMVDFNVIAWHAGVSYWNGVKGLNKVAIGIEVVNWGLLNGQPGNYRSYVGTRIPDDQVILANHKNYDPHRVHAWETFGVNQLEATFQAALAIVNHYKIPAANVLGHDDISPGRKQDPGPAFPMDRLRGFLLGRDEDGDLTYKVNSKTGLNLRVGPGTEHAIVVNLKDGTRVRQTGIAGKWFEVDVLNKDDQPDDTGWVHSNYLVQI
jgi:N-acetylmuramoyl-L-alanine amidase